MTAAAAAVAARLRGSRAGVAVSQDVAALGALALGAALLAAGTWATWGDVGGDTGYDLVAGARFADGEIPYRDFVYYYGPLAPVLLGLAALVGGSSIGSFVALGLAVAFGIVAATYALGRLLLPPIGAALATAIVVPVAFGPGTFNYILPHTFSASIGLLALLLSLLGLGRYAAGADRRALVGAGAAAGLVALTRPEYVLAILAAAALWLCLRALSGASLRRELLAFAGPAVGIPVLVYGALAVVVGPSRLVFENLYPADALAAAGNTLLRLHAPLTASSFAELGGKVVAYAAGAILLAGTAAALWRRHGLRRPALLAGAGLAAVAAAASLLRPETLRYGLELVYGWIPAGAAVALVILLVRWRRREGGWSPSDQLALAGTAALAVLAAKTYGAFFLHAPAPQMAVYAAPLAALFLARLHLVELARGRLAVASVGAAWLAFLALAGAGLTLKDARVESARVAGPGGELAAPPVDAAAYQEALKWIAAGSGPDAPPLLAPQLTALYTLAGRQDPLPEISLLPGALPGAAEERAATRRLDAAGVRLVVVDRRPFSEYGHGMFGETFDRDVARWLETKFVRAAVLRRASPGAPPLEVWLRRAR